MKNLLLIGSGKWGQKYISTLSTFSDVKFIIATRNNWQSLVDAKPDGVIICTGPHVHVEIAKYVLEQHIPVMIEKPVALSLQELEPLLSLQHNAPILVNYIHLFANQFISLKKAYNKIHDTSHISCAVTGIGPFRHYSSLFDYGPHAISMCLSLLNDYPSQIIASRNIKSPEHLFSIQLEFQKNNIVNILVGSGAESKECYIKYNNSILYSAIHWENNSPSTLTNAIQCFIDLINGKRDVRQGLDLTIKVVKILEECYKQVSEVR